MGYIRRLQQRWLHTDHKSDVPKEEKNTLSAQNKKYLPDVDSTSVPEQTLMSRNCDALDNDSDTLPSKSGIELSGLLIESLKQKWVGEPVSDSQRRRIETLKSDLKKSPEYLKEDPVLSALITSDECDFSQEQFLSHTWNDNGDTLLHLTVRHGFDELLLPLMSMPWELNQRNSNGETVLGVGIGTTPHLNVSYLVHLLDKGAHPDYTEVHGKHPYDYCVNHESENLEKFSIRMIRKGAFSTHPLLLGNKEHDNQQKTNTLWNKFQVPQQVLLKASICQMVENVHSAEELLKMLDNNLLLWEEAGCTEEIREIVDMIKSCLLSDDSSPDCQEMNRFEICRDLLVRVMKPEEICQGGTFLCGPTSLLTVMARTRPLVYAQYILDLYQNGVGSLGKLKLKTNADKLDFYNQKISNAVDRLGLSSLAGNKYHALFDMHRPNTLYHLIKATTGQGEQHNFIRNVRERRTTMLPKILELAEKEVPQIILLDVRLLLGEQADRSSMTKRMHFFGLPDHYVALNSLKKESDGQLTIEVTTWGGKMQRKISEEHFCRYCHAYFVVAEPKVM